MRTVIILCFVFFFVCERVTAQSPKVTVSGLLKETSAKASLPFVNVTLNIRDTVFVTGTITNEEGRFTLSDIAPGSYTLALSYVGYEQKTVPVIIGQMSNFLDLGVIEMNLRSDSLGEVIVTAKQETVSLHLDKKTFNLADNISQSGGSVLEAMRNLPGVTTQDGKVQLRGNDKVTVLIDGKQTALTGFGSQTGLDNIPASAIEKIEIINNPSSKYDANGNAGIINIIYKKEKKEGLNGKVGLTGGLGALWIKKDNLPGIRPQYQGTPKINPSLSVNYRKNKVNLFLQADDLFTKTLNKNEFVNRFYDNGDTVFQQLKRNRTTNFITVKTGADFFVDPQNTITVSGLFGSEKILDRGDQPFFDGQPTKARRLWQFLEDELKTTATGSATWQHKFDRPGRVLNAGFNYTFHREDEKYFFKNILPDFIGLDSFKLLSDERVADFNLDYVHPLKRGRFESGIKFRRRTIPVNMQFKPGLNSPLDSTAGGYANYFETIPALYGTYVYESNHIEVEAGMRVEYVQIRYDVNPNHPVYKSDGYNYFQAFPNVRMAYKLDENNKLSLFYNRRVDRPNEVDIRIFPKYDDAEIIKVGNPALQPQFTNTYEVGYKTNWSGGYLFPSVYHKRVDATISRIGSIVPGNTLIYNIFQNAGKSYSTGFEILFSQDLSRLFSLNASVTGYKNIVDSFTVVNKYPVENVFSADREEIFSGNVKVNGLLHLPRQFDAQLTAVYQAPDLIPQGKVFSRFSIDAGLKKVIQKGRGELIVNATDIANTLQIKREIKGNGFRYVSTDYYETQVFRVGYSYKF